MKNLVSSAMLLACSFILISASCKKEKAGIDGLPPATQTGEQTFGCLVNGVVFIPKGASFGGPIRQSYYQSLNGSLYFLVAGTDKSNSEKVLGVDIRALDVELQSGMVISLVEESSGQASGLYHHLELNSTNEYKTNSINKGELKITRFDDANQIVSGTFWFDAVNNKGEKVEVREGRFDMRFTK